MLWKSQKMGEEERKKRVVVESLGWLTESSIMPKKHRAIEGVGASSILELKAELYKSQEESKKSKELNGPDVEYHRAKKKIAPHDTFSLKNSGVDARALKYIYFPFFLSLLNLIGKIRDFSFYGISIWCLIIGTSLS